MKILSIADRRRSCTRRAAWRRRSYGHSMSVGLWHRQLRLRRLHERLALLLRRGLWNLLLLKTIENCHCLKFWRENSNIMNFCWKNKLRIQQTRLLEFNLRDNLNELHFQPFVNNKSWIILPVEELKRWIPKSIWLPRAWPGLDTPPWSVAKWMELKTEFI